MAWSMLFRCGFRRIFSDFCWLDLVTNLKGLNQAHTQARPHHTYIYRNGSGTLWGPAKYMFRGPPKLSTALDSVLLSHGNENGATGSKVIVSKNSVREVSVKTKQISPPNSIPAGLHVEKEARSVLVHGSEGLDATLLVTSLTQIILNPDCRTVRGLQALVEREWLQAGHPFPRRHSHSVYSPSRSKQNAPTFLLLLDCIVQIQTQFPCSFEFSSSLLMLLFEHSYSSQFGTFLGNCEEERERLQLSKKTASLWSYLNRPEVLQEYLNPLYEPNNRIIWPSVAPVSLNLWEELYLRWVIDQTERKQAWRQIMQLRDKDKELRMKAGRLRRQLADLEREAIQAGVLAPAH
ncbi:Myotubularin- protein 9 [Homalodisca vitripennis]|nr:Myotubularin- protein 9 [Homalodisca vitripennis]